MTDLPKILHVEDDPDIREIALIALETIGGLPVVQCASGTDALTCVSEVMPDLFLLDMSMPDMDGIETLNALRALPGLSTTPAIFMTARAQAQEHAELLSKGAVAVISKPFDAMSLARDICEIWDGIN